MVEESFTTRALERGQFLRCHGSMLKGWVIPPLPLPEHLGTKLRYGIVSANGGGISCSASLSQGVTPQVERDFLRTLSLVRSKDPSIYEKSTKFYSDEGIWYKQLHLPHVSRVTLCTLVPHSNQSPPLSGRRSHNHPCF